MTPGWYTGQGTAGQGGFIYDTNKNADIAAVKNNICAGKLAPRTAMIATLEVGCRTPVMAGNQPTNPAEPNA